MKDSRVLLSFRKRPGALATIARAVLGASMSLKEGDRDPNIRAQWENAHVDSAHLKAFASCCNLPDESEYLHPMYPLTLVFPLIMRILGHKKAPFMVFRTLNTRLQVVSHRRIGVNEVLDLACETDATRIVPKGFELDVRSVVQADHAIVWASIHTFYYRGNFGAADSQASELPSLQESQSLGSWYLPNRIGFRFAGISGDSNGIHYSGWYARRMGFNRAFAQPILVLIRSLSCLEVADKPSFRLDAYLKEPVYYNSNVFLRGIAGSTSIHFDIYCEDNPRPSLCCQYTEM
ncbi:MAG: hypothetical protein LDL33_15520 [Desulfomonile sp.]|nr:hypothetical protein [Desulfomonile sp.]